jgi:hypothetical protein
LDHRGRRERTAPDLSRSHGSFAVVVTGGEQLVFDDFYGLFVVAG